MQEHVSAPVWNIEPAGMSDMRRLAKRVVDGMPLVSAAILFGSRARKTARRDSDWDIALLALLAPERYKWEVLRSVPGVPTVSYVSLSPKRLRERHNHIGTLERSVVRDGILLAGEWTMPKSKQKPKATNAELANGLHSSANHINLAVTNMYEVVDSYVDYGDNTLAALSQQSAEHLVKSALRHRGIDYPHTHRALMLAEALRKQYPTHCWIETIESLNGKSAALHIAEYDYKLAEEVDASLARLHKTLEFYERVVEAIAKKRPKFKEHLQVLRKEVVKIISRHQGDEIYWNKLPSELRQNLLNWRQMAIKHLKERESDESSLG